MSQPARKRRNGSVRVLLVAVLLACCLKGLGCDEGDRRAALTDEEIERLSFAQKPNRPDELIVSGETITCDELLGRQPGQDVNAPTLRDELIEAARNTPPLPFLQATWPRVQQRLNTRISSIVLYQRAKQALGDKADERLDEMAEKELSKFVLEYGGNGAAVDAALQRMGMNRARYKEFQKRQILGQYYVQSKFPYNRPITHSQLLEYYERMKDESFYQPGLLQLRLIDIHVDEVEPSRIKGVRHPCGRGASANASGGTCPSAPAGVSDREKVPDPFNSPAEAARALAEDLAAQIEAGADFAELAKEFSHGYRAEAGGLWRPRDPKALAAPYDVLAEKSENMAVGQVAGPIEAAGRVFIMRVEQKQEEGYQPLSDVQNEVEQEILADRRRAALKALDREVAEQAAVARTDLFVRDCLERLYRAANAATVEP